MNERTIFLILILVIFLFFGFLFLKNKIGSISLEGIENKIILFVGNGCPHCAEVEKFIIIKETLNF